MQPSSATLTQRDSTGLLAMSGGSAGLVMIDLPVAAPALPPDIASNPVLSRWVRVAEDGCIEVYAGKVELGQGIWTTQLQIAADELDVKPSAIRLRVGDTALCPDQGLTVGSNSTQVGAMALRRICAEVRQLFVQAAAPWH